MQSVKTVGTGLCVRILMVLVVCSSLRKCSFFLVEVLVLESWVLYIFSITITLDDGIAFPLSLSKADEFF